MQLKPDTFALTVVLALLTALGPLATDMYLPSLPAITAEFSATIEQTQLTLSLFMLGFGSGQLLYGPVSDRLGRRPVLVTSIAIILAADMGCALAGNMEMLIVARFVQGLATAGPIVLARSIVRDLYEGRRAGQELSRMGSVMGLVPATAPFFGALIHAAAGWRVTFAVQTALAGALGAIILLALPETIGARRRTEPLTLRTYPRIYSGLLSHGRYRLFVAIACTIFAGLFSFIATSSFVLQQAYGLSALAFGVSFGLVSLAYVSGTIVGTRLVGRSDIPASLRSGAWIMLGGAVAMAVLALASGGHAAEIVVPMMIYMVGLGIAFPQSIAGAMMPFPDRAGAASSMLGFLQMGVGASIGLIAAWLFDGSGIPLALIILICSVATLLLSRRVS